MLTEKKVKFKYISRLNEQFCNILQGKFNFQINSFKKDLFIQELFKSVQTLLSAEND